MHIPELYKRHTPTISFEFFPPKTIEAEKTLLLETVPALKALNPSFISVTYGAGGSTRDTTLRVVNSLRRQHGIESVSHLTCVGSTREMLADLLAEYERLEIHNLLALRGDPPRGQTSFTPVAGGFAYALDLIKFIKSQGNFRVGAAVYPEGHVECAHKHVDWDRAAAKVEAGAEFLISQLFYDWSDFLDMEDYLRSRRHVKVPIIPGILPFQGTEQIKRFTSLCGSKIPGPMRVKLEALAGDDESVRRYGVEICTEICAHLLKEGVKGLHFYCLNRAQSVTEILKNLKLA